MRNGVGKFILPSGVVLSVCGLSGPGLFAPALSVSGLFKSGFALAPSFSVLGFLFMLRESLSCSRYSTYSSPRALMTSLNDAVGRFVFIAEVELASNTQRTRQCETAMKHEIVDC